MHGTSSFSIETHGFGKALGNDHLETFLHKVPLTISVFVQITTGKALVGSVEEGKQVVLLHHSCNLVPLLRGRVNTCWVVGTSVEQNDGAWLGIVQILEHAIEIQSLCLGIIIRVISNLETS